jgi:hypothetical protein
MATTSSTKDWVSVPDGSTLTIKTEADPPNVEITITIDDGDKTTTWTSDDVLNKSKSLTIQSPKIYTIAITMAFAGAKTTLDFDARIKKPTGKPHGKPFTFAATRPPNTQHADIGIETEDGQ